MTRKKESASSGYGSAGSESEHDLVSVSFEMGITFKRDFLQLKVASGSEKT